MGNPVVHFEIMGKDSAKLRDFYEKAFGWEFEPPMGPQQYSLVAPDPGQDRGIRGGIGTAPDGYEGGPTFYIGVPDINAAFDTVSRLGGAKMMGPVDAPGGIVIGYFRDPDGFPIGLVQIPPSG